MRLAALSLIALGLWASGAPGAALPEPLLVAVGDVTATTAVLWVRAPTTALITVELTSRGSAVRRVLAIAPSCLALGWVDDGDMPIRRVGLTG